MSAVGYIAADGLMALRLKEFKQAYKPQFPETVLNDNGVLYLTLYYMLNGHFDKKSYLKAIELTKHESVPGLYHRNPGRDGSHSYSETNNAVNSHDNYEAMACGCICIKNTNIFKPIVKLYPFINNVAPGKLNPDSIHTRTPSGFHSPASGFLYYLAAGLQPTWLQTIFFCARNMIIAFKYKHYTNHSEHIRSWMRNRAVQSAMHLLSSKKQWVVRNCLSLFNKKIYRKSGGLGVYFNDFAPNHPLRILGTRLGPDGHDLYPFD